VIRVALTKKVRCIPHGGEVQWRSFPRPEEVELECADEGVPRDDGWRRGAGER
jgi:hypothetical protein